MSAAVEAGDVESIADLATQAGAPIALGWSSPSEARKQTQFRFTLPAR